MAAFFVSRAQVKNPEKMAEYGRRAGQTLAAHGGELVLKGRLDGALLGEAAQDHATGIVRFASMEALRQWYDSDAYQALAPLRDEACAMTLIAYEAAD